MPGSRGRPQAQTVRRTNGAAHFGGSSFVKQQEEEAEAATAGGMAPLPGPAAPPRLLLLPAASTAPAPAPGAPSPSPPPRKRQRLAHLSPEEKALRRKLKNRVAAQSARDRKKARMGELERQAVELEAENQKLVAENRRLQERAHSLARENHDLRLRLGLPALKVETQEETASIAPGGAETGSSESAALRLRVPPQQGQAQQSSASTVGERKRKRKGGLPLGTDSLASSDAESDLLLGILDSLDPNMFLHCSSSQATFFEKLQQEVCGEAAVPLPASTSPSLGPAPLKQDAINELIRFDHEYTKPFFLEIISEAATQTSALLEEVVASPPLQAPVSVKEEPADTLLPDLGLSHLLSSDQRPPSLLDAASDSGYEGSPSPFSDLSSPVDTDCSWEEAFAKELFPQLISV
ncbi:LOW QUALITY PROTEIN: X-box-binding protein 1 [Notechis scutatus]|uniref:X-box-binding protein 1 n=1 Tax=Notechis scutatus TaxID=8663 RepID=A0A6J1VMV4_9SAUR|nr:LOW QUALITY PROTEIN: X-box-binding protein 1 [Notechis scutatus]